MQVCGRPQLLLDLMPGKHVDTFKQRLRDVVKKGGANAVSFESFILRFSRREVRGRVGPILWRVSIGWGLMWLGVRNRIVGFTFAPRFSGLCADWVVLFASVARCLCSSHLAG